MFTRAGSPFDQLKSLNNNYKSQLVFPNNLEKSHSLEMWSLKKKKKNDINPLGICILKTVLDEPGGFLLDFNYQIFSPKKKKKEFDPLG